MLVSYDTERTSSFEILAGMSGQSLCAERIGYNLHHSFCGGLRVAFFFAG